MRQARAEAPITPRVIGDIPLGVTKRVSAAIVRNLRQQLAGAGHSTAVKALRFIPSSRTNTETGSFQFVVNALIDVASVADHPQRSEALDTVVTVGRGRGGQILESVTIPALVRQTADT